MQAITPYLYFSGNGADALAFYATALNGRILHSQTYGDSGMTYFEQDENRILHALFEAGKLQFMVSDLHYPDTLTHGNHIGLSFNFDDLELMNKTFTNLGAGGKIIMDLQDTSWGARFGMLEDKFGVNWMFNFDYPKEEN
jgi:PhnB protein